MTHQKLRDVTEAESIPRAVNLSERIMGLRIAAAAVYDRAKLMGKSDEQAAEDIKPIRHALKTVIHEGVKHDLAGCVLTVHRLRATAKAHEEDMKFLMQKAVDAEHHANEICRSIVEHMNTLGVKELIDRDFSAVLTVEGDQEKLMLR